MPILPDLEINLDGMEDSLKIIEKSLNDIIHNHNLSVTEMRASAQICVKAVNKYTEIANRNVRLLNEQAFYLLDKVRKIQNNSQVPYDNEDSKYHIH